MNSPLASDMYGKNVGSLLFRDYDALMISEAGGTSIRNTDALSRVHSYYDFLNLLDKVENGHLHGT